MNRRSLIALGTLHPIINQQDGISSQLVCTIPKATLRNYLNNGALRHHTEDRHRTSRSYCAIRVLVSGFKYPRTQKDVRMMLGPFELLLMLIPLACIIGIIYLTVQVSRNSKDIQHNSQAIAQLREAQKSGPSAEQGPHS